MRQQLGTHSEGPQRSLEFQVFTVMAQNGHRHAQHGVEAFRRALLVDTVIYFHFLNRHGDVRVFVRPFPMQEVLEQTHVGRKVH